MFGAQTFSKLPLKIPSFVFAHSNKAKDDISKFSYLKNIFAKSSKSQIDNIVCDIYLDVVNKNIESNRLQNIEPVIPNRIKILQTIQNQHPELAGRRNLKVINNQINQLRKSQESWSKKFPLIYMPHSSGKNCYLSKIKIEDCEKWCVIEKHSSKNTKKFFKQSESKQFKFYKNTLAGNQTIDLAQIRGITFYELEKLNITPLCTQFNQLWVGFKSDDTKIENDVIHLKPNAAYLTTSESLPKNITYSITSLISQGFESDDTESISELSRSERDYSEVEHSEVEHSDSEENFYDFEDSRSEKDFCFSDDSSDNSSHLSYSASSSPEFSPRKFFDSDDAGYFSDSALSSTASSPKGWIYTIDSQSSEAPILHSPEPEQIIQPEQIVELEQIVDEQTLELEQPPIQLARLIQQENSTHEAPVQLEKLISQSYEPISTQFKTTQSWIMDLRARFAEGFLTCIACVQACKEPPTEPNSPRLSP